MTARIIALFLSLRYSYWFLPSLLIVAAFFLSLLMVWTDHQVERSDWELPNFIYQGGPEGARSVLSTVASSMISVTGITFSITIVVLTLASSQFGPRLLRNFMRDTGNQLVLGVFLATFVYALMVLRRVGGLADPNFVPHLAVTVGLLLAIGSIGFLLYFIHHVAQSIQAENVIAEVAKDLDSAISEAYPKMIGEAPVTSDGSKEPDIAETPTQDMAQIFAKRSGYVQAIEGDGLLELAREADVVIRIIRRPGDFLIPGGLLLEAWPVDQVTEAMRESAHNCFLVGSQRTGEQDVEYAINQLVEIALRALSPGINDPFTAINCIDRLGAALARLAQSELPSGHRFDSEDKLRIITEVDTFEAMLDTAFDPIRECARTHTSVTLRLLEIIQHLSRRARKGSHQRALLRQAEMVERGSHQGLPEENDRKAVQDCFKEASTLINSVA